MVFKGSMHCSTDIIHNTTTKVMHNRAGRLRHERDRGVIKKGKALTTHPCLQTTLQDQQPYNINNDTISNQTHSIALHLSTLPYATPHYVRAQHMPVRVVPHTYTHMLLMRGIHDEAKQGELLDDILCCIAIRWHDDSMGHQSPGLLRLSSPDSILGHPQHSGAPTRDCSHLSLYISLSLYIYIYIYIYSFFPHKVEIP